MGGGFFEEAKECLKCCRPVLQMVVHDASLIDERPCFRPCESGDGVAFALE